MWVVNLVSVSVDRPREIARGKGRGKLFAMLASGHVAGVWWRLIGPLAHALRPNQLECDDDESKGWDILDLAAQGMCILHDRHGMSFLESTIRSSGWSSSSIIAASLYCRSFILEWHVHTLAENYHLRRRWLVSGCAADSVLTPRTVYETLGHADADLARIVVSACIGTDPGGGVEGDSPGAGRGWTTAV